MTIYLECHTSQSVNGKGGSEIIQGDVHRYPGIYINFENCWRQPDEGCSIGHRLKCGP